MTETLLWVLSIALILMGLAGTVLPALPGTAFVLGGIVLGAWIDDFSRVGTGVVAASAVLAVVAWVLDYVAGLLGARKAGASIMSCAKSWKRWMMRVGNSRRFCTFFRSDNLGTPFCSTGPSMLAVATAS